MSTIDYSFSDILEALRDNLSKHYFTVAKYNYTKSTSVYLENGSVLYICIESTPGFDRERVLAKVSNKNDGSSVILVETYDEKLVAKANEIFWRAYILFKYNMEYKGKKTFESIVCKAASKLSQTIGPLERAVGLKCLEPGFVERLKDKLSKDEFLQQLHPCCRVDSNKAGEVVMVVEEYILPGITMKVEFNVGRYNEDNSTDTDTDKCVEAINKLLDR